MKNKLKMTNIMPIISSIGVGLAAYQMFSGNGQKMNNQLPSIASNMLGMTNGTGQNQQSQ